VYLFSRNREIKKGKRFDICTCGLGRNAPFACINYAGHFQHAVYECEKVCGAADEQIEWV